MRDSCSTLTIARENGARFARRSRLEHGLDLVEDGLRRRGLFRALARRAVFVLRRGEVESAEGRSGQTKIREMCGAVETI